MRRGIGGGIILAHKLPVHNLQPLGRTATSIQTTTRQVKLPKLQSSSLDLPRLGMKVPEETTSYPRLVVFAFNAIKFISRFIGVVISGAGKQKKMCRCRIKTFQIDNMAASYTQERRMEVFCDTVVSTSGLNLQQPFAGLKVPCCC